jgi:hypothetical protein
MSKDVKMWIAVHNIMWPVGVATYVNNSVNTVIELTKFKPENPSRKPSM